MRPIFRARLRWTLPIAAAAVVLAGIGVYRLWIVEPTADGSPPGSPPGTATASPEQLPALPTSTASDPNPESPTEDQRLSQQVLGTWEDDYQGKRTMTLEEGGTGSMRVELQGWSARLFAEQLDFEMTWSINDKKLRARTTGGEPATAVKLILATYGDQVEQPILELTEDRLLLLDEDGTTQYDWQRVR